MLDAVWLVPALPLAGFVVLVVAGKRLGEPLAGWLATAMVGGSFAAAVVTFVGLLDRGADDRQVVTTAFEWIPAGSLEVDVGLLVDPLSITMALFVTGVSALIHLYSIGYMHGDPRFHRFFVYLNLFVFAMTMLVLGDNFVLTFLGWEGVGVCSYLLISFWFEHTPNAVAGKKAFVTTRIGDVGFMLAMFLTFATLGTLQYAGEEGVLEQAGTLTEVTATAIALLLFLAAVGKSAQLPLYFWLPDAMAGPTPVSALIHAATMVTSGVYLMARINPILAQAPDALTVIAWVGAATALFAATIAVAQTDIKKVLAYSTVSQLGFMFLAVGVGAYVAALFHMVTHAFFKALLFLGSGSVIHAMHEEQDMDRMGGLMRFLPVTGATFVAGWLAIIGIPPFSGFWSKDEILISAWDDNIGLWVIGVVTALLTAFYMSRQVFLVFFGEPRWREAVAGGAAGGGHAGGAEAAAEVTGAAEEGEAADAEAQVAASHGPHGDPHTPHESPWLMTLPLVGLAGLAFVGGALNLPFEGAFHLEHWLEPVFEGNLHELHVDAALQWSLPFVVLAVALVGVAAAWFVYLRRGVDRRTVEPEVLRRGWYYDWAVSWLVDRPARQGATLLADQADARGIDGAVNGIGVLVRGLGERARSIQTGFVRNYALGIAAGAILLLGWMISRTGI